MNLKSVDRLEVIALMDNVSDPFTRSHQNMRWNESQYRTSVLKKKELCGADFCRACNGLSLLMRFHVEKKVRTLLFDTGPDEMLVVDNAKRLEADLTKIEGIILSHGHFDHYGGTLCMLDAIGKKDLPVYSHPKLFMPRAFGKESLLEVSYNLTNEDIEEHGGKIIEAKDPLLIFDDCLLISGEVPRETPYESGSPSEHKKIDGKWKIAPDVIDERVLIFHLKNKGLCVFTACGHTGVINAINHAKKLTGIDSVHLIMGGFHLAPPDVKDRIVPTLKDLEALDPSLIVTGHCTGARTQALLADKFPNEHISYGVGTVFNFE